MAFQIGIIAYVYTHGTTRWITVALPATIIEVDVPRDVELQVGDAVKIINGSTFGGRVEDHFNVGPVVKVERIVSDGAVEVALPPFGTKLVACAVKRFKKLREGGRVVLDRSASVVVGVAKESSKSTT
jgi:hypothetical protein